MIIAGTKGYEDNIKSFVETSQTLDFQIVCKDFIPFLPNVGAKVLDLGSGAGQNAFALNQMGFSVTAIEPLECFIEASKATYQNTDITWLNDFLPDLTTLSPALQFEFVLIDGVWHHLCEQERELAVKRIASLMVESAVCAISLRNGPPGLGTTIYPTDTDKTICLFKQYGFRCLFSASNQDSILPNKEAVKWSRIVLQKV